MIQHARVSLADTTDLSRLCLFQPPCFFPFQSHFDLWINPNEPLALMLTSTATSTGVKLSRKSSLANLLPSRSDQCACILSGEPFVILRNDLKCWCDVCSRFPAFDKGKKKKKLTLLATAFTLGLASNMKILWD